jgi:hypothetical protein
MRSPCRPVTLSSVRVTSKQKTSLIQLLGRGTLVVPPRFVSCSTLRRVSCRLTIVEFNLRKVCETSTCSLTGAPINSRGDFGSSNYRLTPCLLRGVATLCKFDRTYSSLSASMARLYAHRKSMSSSPPFSAAWAGVTLHFEHAVIYFATFTLRRSIGSQPRHYNLSQSGRIAINPIVLVTHHRKSS